MNKLRICFGLLTAFLFGTLVVQAAALVGSNSMPRGVRTTPFTLSKEGVPSSVPSSAAQLQNAGNTQKKILNASTNALDEREAKWLKEFEKEAKKGILVDIYEPTDKEKVFVKFKIHKGDRYYYYADKKAQGTANDAQKGYEKVTKYQKAKEAAQMLASKVGENNVAAEAGDRTLTHVERTTATDKTGEHNVIRLIYRDSKGRYFYEDVKIDDGDVVKVNGQDIPAADLMAFLKKIAQKGLDAVAANKKVGKPLPVEELKEAYGKLGTLVLTLPPGEAGRVRFEWRYVYNGVAYTISHLGYVTNTHEYSQELAPWGKAGEEKVQELIARCKREQGITFTGDSISKVTVGEGVPVGGHYGVSVETNNGQSGNYALSPEELAELRAVAIANNPAENVVSEDEKQEALAEWDQNYRELLNDLYMKEMFVKTYNPVFDWQEIEVAKPSNAWFDDAGSDDDEDD